MSWGRTRLDNWFDEKPLHAVALVFVALTVSVTVTIAANGTLTVPGVIIAVVASAAVVGLGALWVYGFGKFVDRISVPDHLGKWTRVYLAVLLVGIFVGGIFFIPQLLSSAIALVGAR